MENIAIGLDQYSYSPDLVQLVWCLICTYREKIGDDRISNIIGTHISCDIFVEGPQEREMLN